MPDWPDEDTRLRVALVSRGLLGEVTDDLRAVAVSGSGDDTLIRLVYEVGPQTEDRLDRLQETAWDVGADAGDTLVRTESVVEESDGPLELRAGETWVFMRREPYV